MQPNYYDSSAVGSRPAFLSQCFLLSVFGRNGIQRRPSHRIFALGYCLHGLKRLAVGLRAVLTIYPAHFSNRQDNADDHNDRNDAFPGHTALALPLPFGLPGIVYGQFLCPWLSGEAPRY